MYKNYILYIHIYKIIYIFFILIASLRWTAAAGDCGKTLIQRMVHTGGCYSPMYCRGKSVSVSFVTHPYKISCTCVCSHTLHTHAHTLAYMQEHMRA